MKHLLSITLMALLLALSCTKEIPAVLNVSTTELSFNKDGGSQNITFLTNKDWTAASSASWATVTGSGSSSATSISVMVEANTEYDDRTATITIKADNLTKTVTIRQSTNLGLIVSKKDFDLTNEAQNIEVEVLANVVYEVTSEANWIQYVETKGLKTSKILLKVSKNEGNVQRVGTVKVKQLDGDMMGVITITQNQGQTSNDSEPFFSKGVELMCLIWKLAGAPEYNECQIKEVNASVNEYFSTMKNHEAVRLAKEYRNIDLSYDAVTAYGLHLQIQDDGTITFNQNYTEYVNDSFYLRWTPQQRDAMLKAVNAFYHESRFDEWFDSLEPLFSKAIVAFKKVCDIDFSWYDSFFSTLQNPSHQIILSFLIGLHNNGLSVQLPDGSIFSSPVMGSVLQNQTGEIYYGNILDIIIHEFCHPFCNPLIYEYWDPIEAKVNEVFLMMRSQMESLAYGSPMTIMCETFVRSCVIRYLLSHYNYNKTELVLQQESLGFLLVDPCVDALELREKNKNLYPTMKDFMPELVQAINNYHVDTYSGRYEEYNNPTIPNLLPGKFSIGPDSQIQFTKSNIYWNGSELKFEENPMDYPVEWNPYHVGHFYWATTLEASVDCAFGEIEQNLMDHLFCDGSDDAHTLSVEGISGLRVLRDCENGEIEYLLTRRNNAERLMKYPVLIKGVGDCLIIAPDDYAGTIEDSYDSNTWADAERNGLVCFAPDGMRRGYHIDERNGKNGAYWCGVAKEDSPELAYGLFFSGKIYHYPSYSSRVNGFSLRLVKDVK